MKLHIVRNIVFLIVALISVLLVANVVLTYYNDRIIVQVVLLVICVPTLLFAAFYTNKAFKLSELVRNAEEEKNKMLSEQNAMLEQKVAERTREISARNEEIVSQNEELKMHQETLSEQNNKLQAAQQHRSVS